MSTDSEEPAAPRWARLHGLVILSSLLAPIVLLTIWLTSGPFGSTFLFLADLSKAILVPIYGLLALACAILRWVRPSIALLAGLAILMAPSLDPWDTPLRFHLWRLEDDYLAIAERAERGLPVAEEFDGATVTVHEEPFLVVFGYRVPMATRGIAYAPDGFGDFGPPDFRARRIWGDWYSCYWD